MYLCTGTHTYGSYDTLHTDNITGKEYWVFGHSLLFIGMIPGRRLFILRNNYTLDWPFFGLALCTCFIGIYVVYVKFGICETKWTIMYKDINSIWLLLPMHKSWTYMYICLFFFSKEELLFRLLCWWATNFLCLTIIYTLNWGAALGQF